MNAAATEISTVFVSSHTECKKENLHETGINLQCKLQCRTAFPHHSLSVLIYQNTQTRRKKKLSTAKRRVGQAIITETTQYLTDIN
jgi:hypothetical protein